jgi:DNA-binding CsgD family transcriptional regulator
MLEGGEITVAVGRIDGRRLVRVEQALRGDGRLCLLASDLDDVALERIMGRQAPRVVVVAESVDFALLARLRARPLAPGLVVLADEPAPLYRMALFEALGAICLERDVSAADLLAAVLLAGQRTGVLTPREVEVHMEMSQRRTDAEIAWRLGISVATVRTHTRAIRRKLGVKSRRAIAGTADQKSGRPQRL